MAKKKKRKLPGQNKPKYVPTPAQIKAETAKIRSNWPPERFESKLDSEPLMVQECNVLFPPKRGHFNDN